MILPHAIISTNLCRREDRRIVKETEISKIIDRVNLSSLP